MGYSHTFRCVTEFFFSIPLFFRHFYQAANKRAKTTRIYRYLQDIFAKTKGKYIISLVIKEPMSIYNK